VPCECNPSNHPNTKSKRGQAALPASVTRLATRPPSPRGGKGQGQVDGRHRKVGVRVSSADWFSPAMRDSVLVPSR
jgi:hypothetical protein